CFAAGQARGSGPVRVVEKLMDAIGAAGAWLIAALVLGIAELAVPGVFLVFLAIAAGVTGVAVYVLPDLPVAAQLAAFGVWSASRSAR
ncbi:NfeD family protein, partial [Pseudomonas aeruginosa]